MKVLIADDEIKVCRLIQHLVDWDALEMDIIGFANDGKTAYESICEKKPDIVITDIRMPVYDGLELIRRAKEVNPEINFIVISGYSQFEYAQQAIKYGVKDYLLKPLKKRELENSLTEIKESHESLIKSTRIRNEMESIIEASREHIRENFLMKTLQNSATNPLKADMSLEQLNEQYGCKFHKGFFTAVRVRPFFSKNSDKSAGDSEEFVMNKIHQMVKEKLEIYCETYMSTVYQDEIVCILNTVDKEIEPVRKKLKHLIVNVSNLKTVFPDIRIRIGQGNTHSSYMGITDSFREAELAIMNRMGENEDTYICYSEDSKSGKTKEEIFDSGLRNEILTYQERMDIEGTLRLVDKVGEKLKPFKYDGKLVYEVFGELVETLRFGMKYSREGRNLFLIEDYKKQYRRIWDYDELFQWIKSDLSRVHQVYMKNIQDEESKPIRDAKKYIHDNFNKHISLENVSEYIGFNAAYFSTLFKKETGKNFLEYVTDIEGTLRLVDKVGEKLKPFKYDGKLVYEVFGELVETLRFGMKYSREGRNLFLIEDYKKQYRRIWDYDELFQWIKSDLSRVHQVYMKNIQDEESKPIRDAKKYIHDNFNKHISLENVSEYIGFNAAYFSTLFKKETGKNFLEYVTELRIQNAKNYLIQTNYDIAEVASAVGYNDLKYFSKLFKKTTGLNPSEFRKLYS